VSLSAAAVVRLKSTLSHLVLLQNFVVGFKSTYLDHFVARESRAEQPVKLTLFCLAGQVFIKEISRRIQLVKLGFVTFSKNIIQKCHLDLQFHSVKQLNT
jgi:hypothetical protein